MAKAKVIKNYRFVEGHNPYADRGNEGSLVTNIDLGFAKQVTEENGEKFDGSKYEVYFPRLIYKAGETTCEKLDAEAKSFWGNEAGLQVLLDAGIRQLTTRVTYRKEEKEESEYPVERHAYAQEAADNYNIGRQQPTSSNKAKIQKANWLEAQAKELEMTPEEMIEFIKTSRKKSKK